MFNELAQSNEIQLSFVVQYDTRTAMVGPPAFDPRISYVVAGRNPGRIWHGLTRGDYEVLVIAGYSLAITRTSITWAIWRRRPFVLWCESHLKKPRSWFVRLVKRLILPAIVKRAGAGIAISSWAADYLVHYGARRNDVAVMPYLPEWPGGEVECGGQQRLELKSALGLAPVPMILWVGRMVDEKDLGVLLQALAVLPNGVAWQMVFVGDGPNRAGLEAMAGRLKLLRHVQFAGTKGRAEVGAFYRAADVFVLPSTEETFGAVVPEAMAFGLPVVTTNAVGSSADFVRDGSNGFIVAPHDAPALQKALSRLLADADLRCRMGLASRAMLRGHSIQRNANSFMQAVGWAMNKQPGER
jgi:glycosyltransferase involved in cell wall biosynthesis